MVIITGVHFSYSLLCAVKYPRKKNSSVIGPAKTLNIKYTAQVAKIIFLGKLFMYSILLQSKPIGKNNNNFSRNVNSSAFSSG